MKKQKCKKHDVTDDDTLPFSNIIASSTSMDSSIGSSFEECNYDDPESVTALYKAIEAKNWTEIISLAMKYPEQVSTWIIRREKGGNLRWRVLPLHAAIIFQSPDRVIESILASYPKAVKCKDDHGMIPLHLALRNGASEGIINLLLEAYPQSIYIKDRKGRVPIDLASACSSPNKEAFVQALERGQSYFAMAATFTNQSAVVFKQKTKFEEIISKLEKKHKLEVELMKDELDELKKTRENMIISLENDIKNKNTDIYLKKEFLEGKISSILEEAEARNKNVIDNKVMYEDKISTLENDLKSSQSMTAVFNGHINALETQLKSRNDMEEILVKKIKAMEEKLKDHKNLIVDLNVEKRLNKELQERVLSMDSELVLLRRKNIEKNISYELLQDYKIQIHEYSSKEESFSCQLSDTLREVAELEAKNLVLEAEREMFQKHYEKCKIDLLKVKLQNNKQNLSQEKRDEINLNDKNDEETICSNFDKRELVKKAMEAQEIHMQNIQNMFQKQLREFEELQFHQRFLMHNVENNNSNSSSVEYMQNTMEKSNLEEKENNLDNSGYVQKSLNEEERQENEWKSGDDVVVRNREDDLNVDMENIKVNNILTENEEGLMIQENEDELTENEKGLMIQENEDDSNFGNILTDEDMENKRKKNTLSGKEIEDLIIQKREEEDSSLSEDGHDGILNNEEKPLEEGDESCNEVVSCGSLRSFKEKDENCNEVISCGSLKSFKEKDESCNEVVSCGSLKSFKERDENYSELVSCGSLKSLMSNEQDNGTNKEMNAIVIVASE